MVQLRVLCGEVNKYLWLHSAPDAGAHTFIVDPGLTSKDAKPWQQMHGNGLLLELWSEFPLEGQCLLLPIPLLPKAEAL